jgi:hypothetical protein
MAKSGTNQHNDLVLNSKQIAKDAFTEALRELARNILAISEGGGAPGELVNEIVKIAECLLVFNEIHGGRPASELIREVLTRLGEDSQS